MGYTTEDTKIEDKHHSFKDQKLKAKTMRQFQKNRVETNDEFVADKIRNTIYVQGFDKADTNENELLEYFEKFDGAIRIRKRCYRTNASEDDKEGEWMFTGSVFVTFDSHKKATYFLDESKVVGKGLKYNGDSLKAKWQEDFYVERGKFKRELKTFREEF